MTNRFPFAIGHPVEVSYHAEYLQPARPAVNVKLPPFHFDKAYSAAYARLVANPALGEEGADHLAEIAYNILAEDFWKDAAIVARDYGLGPIEQEGRGGGWLVLTGADDPQALTGAQRRAWLTGYELLRDWCRASIAGASSAVAALMLDMAADRGVAP